jgi:hippurate hydrolase
VPISSLLNSQLDEMTSWRRDLHAHPELGFEESRTSAFIADKLESWGIEVCRGIASTGVVGSLHGGAEGHNADQVNVSARQRARGFEHGAANKARPDVVRRTILCMGLPV